MQTAEGKLHLYVAINRTSKFAFAQLVEKANRRTASAFLEALIRWPTGYGSAMAREAPPSPTKSIRFSRTITAWQAICMANLPRGGIQFTLPPRYRNGPTASFVTHMFGMRCQENGIEHRLTKVRHPWTNGQVERMNRTIKDATVKRFHYETHEQLRHHLADFLNVYNYARRLKTLCGLTPYEHICKCWTSEPDRFTLDPRHQMPELNT